MMRAARWGIAGTLLAVGCQAEHLEPVELERHHAWTAASVCVSDPAKVDVLFVIDDSPSMAEEAAMLGEALRGFGEIYERDAAALDYRIGVISTHVSRPGCDPGPDGALRARSCREHLGDFVVTASHESAPQDVSTACEEVCGLDAVATLPTRLPGDVEPQARPWIQREAGVHNLPDGVEVPEALACLASLGVAGCERESPVGAVMAALQRFSDRTDPSYGFLRDEAGLAIIFVGDEDDCSLPFGARELDGAGLPSAQCWEAAADCDDEGCDTRQGGPLLDVGELRDVLDRVQARKQRVTGRTDQRVFVTAVAGVPLGWPDSAQTFGPEDSPEFVEAFGVGPGCEGEGHRAAPLVRLRDLASAFSPWDSDLVSICEAAWERAASCLPGAWPPRTEALCLEVPSAVAEQEDFDPEEECTLTQTRNDESFVLPACVQGCIEDGCEDESWLLPEGEDACVAWESRFGPLGLAGLDASCSDAEQPAQARILRRSREWTGSCLSVTCGHTE